MNKKITHRVILSRATGIPCSFAIILVWFCLDELIKLTSYALSSSRAVLYMISDAAIPTHLSLRFVEG